MTSRSKAVADFLATTAWAKATAHPLAGDASNRRYERLYLDGETAVLMDAPPDKGEDVKPFIAMSEFLGSLGLSAPRVFACDKVRGFLILEDLGDDLYARVLMRAPALEPQLYAACTDALVTLHRATPPNLAVYDVPLMTDLAATAITRYRAGITGQSEDARTFQAAFAPTLARLTDGPGVVVQRDYHAENLLWLPERNGVARVGMLDFQDAMVGHPAYDLVSVLQDARRDVPSEIEATMIRRYIDQTGTNPDAFQAAYAALGIQRNMRILGVFAKLSLDMGKPHYVDFIPRVWGLLQRDLNHPAVSDIAPMIRDLLPAPTPANLLRLKPA